MTRGWFRQFVSLFLLVIFLTFKFSTFASEVNSQVYELAVRERIMRVKEFNFIREEAEKMGVRVYLFGGTAAGFGHYVRLDLLREKGDQSYYKNRFDYHFTNIYRSTQDADLVVDGSKEQARRLQETLKIKFPHLQGSKTAWEVRLLRENYDDKIALLNNPQFLNQHSDSNSVGLIEITQTPIGELQIRDLKNWNSRESRFFEDLRRGEILFYFSDSHEQTQRYLQGLNPPIFSVVRYLTKIFQFGLTIDPESLRKIKKIIRKFNLENDLKTTYAQNWIERNAKKLFQQSEDVERAWNISEELGLRKKLLRLGSIQEEKSLSWWMDKEPLRSRPFGRSGRKASDLGIKVVAHETKNFLTYEAITFSTRREPNVFKSRAGVQGESALLGNGFYTKKGLEGARGTGFTIRFDVHPDAREGDDFEVYGDAILFLNRAALKVIPESLVMGALEYFKLLSEDFWSHSDLGIQEKVKQRILTEKSDLKLDDFKAIAQIASDELQKPKDSIRFALVDHILDFLKNTEPSEYKSFIASKLSLKDYLMMVLTQFKGSIALTSIGQNHILPFYSEFKINTQDLFNFILDEKFTQNVDVVFIIKLNQALEFISSMTPGDTTYVNSHTKIKSKISNWILSQTDQEQILTFYLNGIGSEFVDEGMQVLRSKRSRLKLSDLIRFTGTLFRFPKSEKYEGLFEELVNEILSRATTGQNFDPIVNLFECVHAKNWERPLIDLMRFVEKDQAATIALDSDLISFVFGSRTSFNFRSAFNIGLARSRKTGLVRNYFHALDTLFHEWKPEKRIVLQLVRAEIDESFSKKEIPEYSLLIRYLYNRDISTEEVHRVLKIGSEVLNRNPSYTRQLLDNIAHERTRFDPSFKIKSESCIEKISKHFTIRIKLKK